jgi:diguanylate cyclase (GGDEF)-like protein
MSSTPQHPDPVQLLRLAEERVDHHDTPAVQTALQALLPHLGRVATAFDARVQAVALWLAQEQGDHEGAAVHAGEAFRHAQACGEPAVLARVQVYAARSAWFVGDNDEAVAYLERAWRVVEDGDDPLLAFRCQNILGNVLSDQGHSEASIDCHLRAAAIARQADLPKPQALAESNAAGRWLDIGDRAHDAGQPDAACAAWERTVVANEAAFALAERAQAPAAMVGSAINRALALARLGRAALAEAGFEQAVALAHEQGGFRVPVYAALGRARMWFALKDLDAAQRCAEDGLALAETTRARHALIMLVELCSRIAEERGDLVSALAFHKRYHALHKEQERNRAEQRSRVLAVRLETAGAHAETARQRQKAQQLTRANADLAERAEQLSHEATVDPLTGVANRRQLDRVIEAAHAEAVTQGQARCVALLDVDHFKQVNDRFSHATGDQVLQSLADLLQQQCRDRDLVARYGGEEFVLLFHGIDLARAQVACERVRQAVQSHDWSKVATGLVVTVSLGVTDMAVAGSAADALAQADRWLYQAKAAGRNRVVAG